jgi:fatty acid synthase subunit beta
MCAVNPSRISKTFNESALRYVVEQIGQQTGWLLEIVNFNVENQQYVCAGNHMALDTLGNVLNFLKQQKIDLDILLQTSSLEDVTKKLADIIAGSSEKSREKRALGPLELERGHATIPLKGIDVRRIHNPLLTI